MPSLRASMTVEDAADLIAYLLERKEEAPFDPEEWDLDTMQRRDGSE
jgi:hypothetical protein